MVERVSLTSLAVEARIDGGEGEGGVERVGESL